MVSLCLSERVGGLSLGQVQICVSDGKYVSQ